MEVFPGKPQKNMLGSEMKTTLILINKTIKHLQKRKWTQIGHPFNHYLIMKMGDLHKFLEGLCSSVLIFFALFKKQRRSFPSFNLSTLKYSKRDDAKERIHHITLFFSLSNFFNINVLLKIGRPRIFMDTSDLPRVFANQSRNWSILEETGK